MEAFDGLEMAYKRDGREILYELGTLERDVKSGLREVTCQGNKLDIYDGLRELHSTMREILRAQSDTELTRVLDAFVDRVGEHGGSGPYFRFVTFLEAELMRALRGDPTFTESQSLTETRMRCDFDESDYCTDKYHEQLREQEKELMQMYYEMRWFENAIRDAGYSVRNKEDLDRKIKEDLDDISSGRKAASCPGFLALDLEGRGCQDFSTFHNQTVYPKCILEGFSPILVDYGQEGQTVITVDPHEAPSEDLSRRAATLLRNVYNFKAPEGSGQENFPERSIKKLLDAIVKEGLNVNFKEVNKTRGVLDGIQRRRKSAAML